MAYNTNDFEDKKLAWDLRAHYVMLIGSSLYRVDEARRDKNYPIWFRELKLLFPRIHSRIDKDRAKMKQIYERYINNMITLSNKYPKTYFGKSFNSKEVGEIEDVLAEFEHFIYRVLHISQQFGDETNLKGLQ